MQFRSCPPKRASSSWLALDSRLRGNERRMTTVQTKTTRASGRIMMKITIAAALAATLLGGSASAEDALRLAIGQRGNWDTSVSEIGQRAGIFKKHGLTLDHVYTQDADE